MTKTTEWLVEIFRAKTDPASDPEAALRDQLGRFLGLYLEYKGAAGGTLAEGMSWLVEVLRDNPLQLGCPVDLARVKELWRQTFLAPSRLPPLDPPAQLVWLGFEVGCSKDVIDAAMSRLFRAGPLDRAEAYREASEHFRWQAEQLQASAQLH